MDATVIDLCASVFDWARFRQTKGAVKLHLLLGHDGYLPEYAVITEGKRHEVRVARQMRFTPGTMLVFDRGYTDYEWFRRLTRQHVHFVTRLKDNADYGVVEERELPRRKGVRRYQVIFYKQGREGKECFFRRVEFWDETQNCLLVFLTNQMTLSAATIAAVYKERWAIELFFQGAQAVTSREDLRGNFRPRPEDADLGGSDCHVADQVSAVALYLLLVAVELGCPAPPTVVCLPRPLDMDRRSVPITTAARVHAAATGPVSGIE